MEKISKTSLYYSLSEYLRDLGRAGVRDFYRGNVANARTPRDAEIAATVPNVVANAASTVPTSIPDSTSDFRSHSDTREFETRRNATSASASREVALDESATMVENGDERSRRSQALAVVAADVARCERCAELVANRTQTVFGSGDPCAELLFLGEGPGAEEDLQGQPFVGRSGRLLTDMIEKGMGIPRSSVFICNVVRCRPPKNRNPEPEEARACRPFLNATLEIVRPKFICCLGSIAAANLLDVAVPLGKLRGRVRQFGDASVVCTYHPAYLLRNPSAKKQAWEDLQLLMKEMGLPIPGK